MSKKNYLIGGIIVVVVILFILFSGNKETAPPASDSTITQPLTFNLTSQNDSGIVGAVNISDVEGKAKVVLNLTGVPANIEEPAHIHTGTCAELGAPKYTLTSTKNGTSETILEVSLSELVQSGSLAVNVHKSAAEASVYVACGDLPVSSSQ